MSFDNASFHIKYILLGPLLVFAVFIAYFLLDCIKKIWQGDLKLDTVKTTCYKRFGNLMPTIDQ
jgi:hypothetical protein